MKTPLLIAMLLGCMFIATAQKLEYSIQANSGVSYYRGAGTESISFINENNDKSRNYTNNPYGNIQGATYGFDADVKLVIARHFLMGLQSGYEISKNKIDLRQVDRRPYTVLTTTVIYEPLPVGGETVFTNTYINFIPYVGYRINIKKLTVDVTLALDIAYGLSRHEKGATSTYYDLASTSYTYGPPQETVTTEVDRGKPTTDPRVQYGIKLGYGKFGLLAAYSRGVLDYNAGLVTTTYGVPYTSRSVYFDVIKLGVFYRIN